MVHCTVVVDGPSVVDKAFHNIDQVVTDEDVSYSRFHVLS